ncbi:hypothetical protein ECZU27_17980 [Escherichia coli]|nr:hypothetical protein ECZU27_17980 [Escherichia coli]
MIRKHCRSKVFDMYAKHRGSSVYHACVADFCQLAASKDKVRRAASSVCLSRAGKPGRSATDVKGHGSDDALAGGASVVVRDGEAHYMAKGSSLNVFAT